jgi:hypothetical protein
MIKEALQYIIGIQQPRIEEINGKSYYFSNGHPFQVDDCRSCEPIELSTLTSLVEFINEKLDEQIHSKKLIVHVESETGVRLISQFNDDMARWEIIRVKAKVPRIRLNEFVEQESFVIQMQSLFLHSDDKALVLQVAGNVEDKTVASYGDDGVSQKATVKTGLAHVEDVIVPNPVKLMPYRTFHEIGQPESDFVFRMKNTQAGIACALFEADGGMWKYHAVHEIAEYLKSQLADNESIIVLS